MIDDMQENLDAAAGVGMQTLLFGSSRQLRADLKTVGVLRRTAVLNTTMAIEASA